MVFAKAFLAIPTIAGIIAPLVDSTDLLGHLLIATFGKEEPIEILSEFIPFLFTDFLLIQMTSRASVGCSQTKAQIRSW